MWPHHRHNVGLMHLVLVEAKGVLGLVDDGTAGAAMSLTVLAAAELVGDLLTGGLVVIGLSTTGGIC